MAEADYTDVSNVSPTAFRILQEIGSDHGPIAALEGRIEGLYRAIDQKRGDGPIITSDGPLALVSKTKGSAELYIKIGRLRDDPR